jgi:hypothetical protein
MTTTANGNPSPEPMTSMGQRMMSARLADGIWAPLGKSGRSLTGSARPAAGRNAPPASTDGLHHRTAPEWQRRGTKIVTWKTDQAVALLGQFLTWTSQDCVSGAGWGSLVTRHTKLVTCSRRCQCSSITQSLMPGVETKYPIEGLLCVVHEQEGIVMMTVLCYLVASKGNLCSEVSGILFGTSRGEHLRKAVRELLHFQSVSGA